MKKPVMIQGVPYISKTFKIKYELYEKFEKQMVDSSVTPSELLNLIFEEYYAWSPELL